MEEALEYVKTIKDENDICKITKTTNHPITVQRKIKKIKLDFYFF
jgi:hypothetical protein